MNAQTATSACERRLWVERAATTADAGDALATIANWSLDDAERLSLVGLVAEAPGGHVGVDEGDAGAFGAPVGEQSESFVAGGAAEGGTVGLRFYLNRPVHGQPRACSADASIEKPLLDDQGCEVHGGSVLEIVVRVKEREA